MNINTGSDPASQHTLPSSCQLTKITTALEKGDYVLGVYLDFSQAFDTIDDGTLLEKNVTIMESEVLPLNGL